jgi:hypothetical protein
MPAGTLVIALALPVISRAFCDMVMLYSETFSYCCL